MEREGTSIASTEIYRQQSSLAVQPHLATGAYMRQLCAALPGGQEAAAEDVPALSKLVPCILLCVAFAGQSKRIVIRVNGTAVAEDEPMIQEFEYAQQELADVEAERRRSTPGGIDQSVAAMPHHWPADGATAAGADLVNQRRRWLLRGKIT